MQEQPLMVRTWLRASLSDRFGAVLGEDIPRSMLDLLNGCSKQD